MTMQIIDCDLATASGVPDVPSGQAAVTNRQNPEGATNRHRPRCEVRLASLNVGTMGGKSFVEMMRRRKLEVLCVQETKWKGDRARILPGGYKLFHAGGTGRVMGWVL